MRAVVKGLNLLMDFAAAFLLLIGAGYFLFAYFILDEKVAAEAMIQIRSRINMWEMIALFVFATLYYFCRIKMRKGGS